MGTPPGGSPISSVPSTSKLTSVTSVTAVPAETLGRRLDEQVRVEAEAPHGHPRRGAPVRPVGQRIVRRSRQENLVRSGEVLAELAGQVHLCAEHLALADDERLAIADADARGDAALGRKRAVDRLERAQEVEGAAA